MPGMYKYSMEIESNVKKLLLDTKELQDRMDTLEGKEYKINLNIDEKKLGNVISNLEKMLDSLGKGTGDFKQFENLSKELSSIVSEVQSLSKAFGKVDDSGTKTLLSSIQNIDKSLSELSQNILNVNKNMRNMGGNTSGAVKQVENITNAYQDAAKETEKLADAQSKIGQKTNISSGSNSAIEQQIKQQNKLQDEIKETIALTNEYGEVIDVYRGTHGLIGNGNVSNRYHGGTFWTSNRKLATQSYADGNKVTHANLYMRNPYLVHGGGADWDQLTLSIKQGEELEKHLENVYASINDVFSKIQNTSGIEAGHLFDVFDGQLNFTDFENGIQKPIESLKDFQNIFESIDYDNSKIPQAQNYINQLYDLFTSYSRISQLSEKGVLNTNEVVEIAKALKYDGVVFNGIRDGSDDSSDIFVTFEEKQSKVIDMITAAQLRAEEEQQLANILVNTRENLYKTLKSLDSKQVDEFIDKSAFNFVTDGSYMENLGEVLGKADPTDSIDNIKNKIREYINEVVNEFENAQKQIADSTDQTKDAFHSDIDTSSSVKSLENLEEEIKKIFTDANELQNILDSLHNGKYFHLSWTTDGIDETGADGRVRQLSKILKEYGYTINNFKSDSDAFDTSGVINAIKEENNVLEQNTQKVKENTQAKEQNANANLNKYDKRLDSYNGKIDKYQATIDRFNDGGWTSDTYLKNVQAIKNAVHEYETLLNELKGKDASLVTSDDINRLDNYEKKIKDTIATVTNMSASEKGYNFVSGQKELDKIHKLLNENSKMSSEAKAKIKAYYAEIESGNPSMSLDKIHGEILKIYNAEVEAGRAGRTLWDTLKNSGFHQIAAQMAGMVGVYDVINLGKEGFNVVRELNTALTEMRKVSDESLQSLKNYQKESFNTADAIATTGLQMQNSIADWQRLGYSIKEANELAKNSNIYKNVGDMDISTATEHMVSSVQAWKSEFNDDAVKTSEEVMNRYNKIGNEFAISSADIGEAMETSAAALKAGGNDLNEALGIITAGNIIQQDASTTSSAMKILSLRIRGAKADLESMGESTDDLADSTSKLREEIKGLTGVDIMADEDTFKSTAEIIKEIGAVWNQLSDVSQAATLEKLAGKNRASTVAGLIENYETIDKVIEAASNADNSALDENQKIIESIDGRIQQLSNRVQEFWYNLVDDSVVKNAVSALTTIVEGGTKLIDTFGTLPTLLTAIGAGLSFKNVGRDKMYSLSF